MLQTNTYSTAGVFYFIETPFYILSIPQLIYIWSRIIPSVAPFLCFFFKNYLFIGAK